MSNRIRIPALRQKLRGKIKYAVVTLPDRATGRRQDFICGTWGTPAAEAEYRRVTLEWQANGFRLVEEKPGDGAMIPVVVLAYMKHALSYYRDPDGQPTTEVVNLKAVLEKRLVPHYTYTPAADFDSLSLIAIRDGMIRDGLCRKRINRDIDRIKRMFKWAAAQKLVPVTTYQQLATVDGLRRGRSGAKESPPVKPVAERWVNETLPHLHLTVRAMVELQLLTGMRPTEVCIMRTCDIDTSGKIWHYVPAHHKTEHHGHGRSVAIGPRGQEVLRPFLRMSLEEFLFQPREAVETWIAGKRANRKSKVQPSQARRQRKKNAKRQPGERYNRDSYRVAVSRAIERANADRDKPIPHWHPNQLRHARGTLVRKEFGLDAARAVLGHRSPVVTEVYAELDQGKAEEVALKLG